VGYWFPNFAAAHALALVAAYATAPVAACGPLRPRGLPRGSVPVPSGSRPPPYFFH